MTSGASTSFWCATAWLPVAAPGGGGEATLSAPVRDVRLSADDDGVLVAVERGVARRPQDRVLPGVVVPGLANAHSHAFHRALRGWSGAGGGDFWAWRERMYAVAGVLDPDSYRDLATATYAEMVLAGVTAVGEMHYLHHPLGGGRYDDPNAMAEALRAAAADAGLRLTLLDTCYLEAGPGRPLDGVQQRFGDGDADAWAERVARLRPDATLAVGAAIHSVRAVPPDAAARVAQWSRDAGVPLHVHLSEQPAENEACQAAYGATPTAVLERAGVWGPTTTAVHAVHLTDDDVVLLGSRGVTACLCPTTERDLADGLAPGGALLSAGSPVAVGSDQHVRIDLLGEARGVEDHERLRTGRRGTFDAAALLTMATEAGHRSIGRSDAGRLEVGARADLVALRTDTVRTAGADAAELPLVAGAADVDTVVVGGRVVVQDGQHRLGDVAALLERAVHRVRTEVTR